MVKKKKKVKDRILFHFWVIILGKFHLSVALTKVWPQFMTN